MTTKQIAGRRKVVAAALGSVRAEGLYPSAKTQQLVVDYADGKITASELKTRTLRSVKIKSSK